MTNDRCKCLFRTPYNKLAFGENSYFPLFDVLHIDILYTRAEIVRTKQTPCVQLYRIIASFVLKIRVRIKYFFLRVNNYIIIYSSVCLPRAYTHHRRRTDFPRSMDFRSLVSQHGNCSKHEPDNDAYYITCVYLCII